MGKIEARHGEEGVCANQAKTDDAIKRMALRPERIPTTQ
eukprot:CAMPEP_0119409380 /NCGR_PEP_ID=MMETSP1335-20130426/2682_1 /TAXON_ID=259385 /ORGANISM="Chrysoculter rhomboideus, Strain RCC1486" /LENGTH=38 /DNA_ID= /DNA_START= /DNA_END= /DNA_ORIENTATION=